MAAVRMALIPVVLLCELTVDHPADAGLAFFVLLGTYGVWALLVLALHHVAEDGRATEARRAAERAEPFVDLIAIAASRRARAAESSVAVSPAHARYATWLVIRAVAS